MTHFDQLTPSQLNLLAQEIKVWGKQLGFNQIGICDVDLTNEEKALQTWLDNGYQGEMKYMESHGMMRARPQELHPGCIRVITGRMDYLPPQAGFATNLSDPNLGYISRYAGGRDYHKLIRQRMKKLGEKIQQYVTDLNLPDPNFRPFVDSAPIMERPLAAKSGLGWTGKHSLLINPHAGSWFFLGELLIDLPLPVDIPIAENCGACVSCIKTCPTNAIIAPYIIDGRRCISYLTIELQSAIPEEFRALMGNRIYGCDDCQLCCPVNSQSELTHETDFYIRDKLKQPQLLSLFNWSEQEFLKNTEGSAIRRIGYERWLRNISVALGNAPYDQKIVMNLESKLAVNNKTDNNLSEMLIEHFNWALTQQLQKQVGEDLLSENRKQSRLIRSIKKGMARDA